MKQTIYILLAVVAFTFSGCSAESKYIGESYDSNLAQQGSDLAMSSNSKRDYTEHNATSYKPSFGSNNQYYSQKDGYVLAKATSGQNIFKQWMLSNGGKRIQCTGFEMDVQCVKNMEYAGVQFFERKAPLNSYTFQIYSDGRFRIQKNEPYETLQEMKDKWSTEKEISKADSHIDLNSYNRLKVQQIDSGNLEIFINGYLVYTIEKENVIFKMPGEIGFIFKTKKDFSLSSTNYAESRFRFKSYQTCNKPNTTIDNSKLEMNRTETFGSGKIGDENITLDHYQYSGGRGAIYTKGMFGGKSWLGDDDQYHGQTQKTLLQGYSRGWSISLVYPFNTSNFAFFEYTGNGKNIANGTQETKTPKEWKLTSDSTVNCNLNITTKKLELTIKGKIQNSGVTKDVDLNYNGCGWE